MASLLLDEGADRHRARMARAARESVGRFSEEGFAASLRAAVAPLLEAKRGDLILWDSRLIHGGLVGSGDASAGGHAAAVTVETPRLARASYTVCMTPRERASEEVLALRERAHAEGTTLCHWPHNYAPHTLKDTAGGAIPSREHTPVELTPAQRRLL